MKHNVLIKNNCLTIDEFNYGIRVKLENIKTQKLTA